MIFRHYCDFLDKGFSDVPLARITFYFVPHSVNGDEVNYKTWVTGELQWVVSNEASSLQLFRIGHAVSMRNIHTAVFDALRLARGVKKTPRFNLCALLRLGHRYLGRPVKRTYSKYAVV